MPSLPGMHRPAHLPARKAEARQREQAFDGRRGSSSERGYNHRWAKAADGHRRHHPLCVGCEAVGWVAAAELVDHTVPHRGDTVLFWDKTNWQSSCRPHHDVVKQRLEQMWKRGVIAASELRLDSATAKRLTLELMA